LNSEVILPIHKSRPCTNSVSHDKQYQTPKSPKPLIFRTHRQERSVNRPKQSPHALCKQNAVRQVLQATPLTAARVSLQNIQNHNHAKPPRPKAPGQVRQTVDVVREGGGL